MSRFPLLAREWSIVRGVLRGSTALVMLGVALLFVACRGEDRYRLLAEPVMMRSVMLPAALVTGGAMAWVSVVRELRAATWDSWLLLPRTRAALATTKIAVGVLATTFAIAIPVVALFVALRAWGAIGGPSITVGDLLFRSVMTQGILIAVAAYLATANAALMARAGHVGFFTPLLVPLLATARFFVGENQGAFVPDRAVAVGLVVTILVLSGALFVSIRRFGRTPNASELSLRTLLATPAATIVVLVIGVIGGELTSRIDAPPPRSRERPEVTTTGIDDEGHIVTRRGRGGHLLSMASMRPLTELDNGSPTRLWTPSYSGATFQIFRDRDRATFLAYENGSGAFLGCIGADGPRSDGRDCTPLDGTPHVSSMIGAALVVTPNSAYHLDDTMRLTPILHGAIHGAVTMGYLDSDWDDAVAVAVDDGVVVVGKHTSDDEAPRVGASCAGAGMVDQVGIAHGFLGLEISGPGSSELVVCRNGTVVERHVLEPKPLAPAHPRSTVFVDVASVAVGPLLSMLASKVTIPRSLP